MMLKFLTKKTEFFDLFDKHAALVTQAAAKLLESISPTIDLQGLLAIKPLEHKADVLLRQCSDLLHQTFITPIDRELTFQLISKIDDVIDCIDSAADCLLIYSIESPTPDLIALASLVNSCAAELEKAVNHLRKIKDGIPIKNCIDAVNEFEHEADDRLRMALGTLFQQEADAKQIIKWKEIYETLEMATDRAADVTDVIHGILLENY